MPPASDRRTFFRHDEAFSPTLRSTLPSRRVARGPGMPWWGAGLRGAVMSLLLILCRRAGCHRRCFFVEGDRTSAEHGINQISSSSLDSLLTGSSLGAQQFVPPMDLAPTDQRPFTPVRGSFARRTSNTPSKIQHSSVNAHASCRSGVPLYGGGCTTNGELGLPSRLCSLGW